MISIKTKNFRNIFSFSLKLSYFQKMQTLCTHFRIRNNAEVLGNCPYHNR
ncbi:hypothetical protein L932_05915 [Helicobacter pylori PZ5026]|nr:hypothetical protein L932_05915 [Helicobacter pylori PZ5026]